MDKNKKKGIGILAAGLAILGGVVIYATTRQAEAAPIITGKLPPVLTKYPECVQADADYKAGRIDLAQYSAILNKYISPETTPSIIQAIKNKLAGIPTGTAQVTQTALVASLAAIQVATGYTDIGTLLQINSQLPPPPVPISTVFNPMNYAEYSAGFLFVSGTGVERALNDYGKGKITWSQYQQVIQANKDTVSYMNSLPDFTE